MFLLLSFDNAQSKYIGGPLISFSKTHRFLCKPLIRKQIPLYSDLMLTTYFPTKKSAIGNTKFRHQCLKD